MDFSKNLSCALQNALAGDERGWDALFERLWPVIAGVVANRLGRAGDDARVEDVAQNVFVRLMENNAARLRRFDPACGVLENYVARIARNCAVDFLRANAKHLRTVDASCIPEPEAGDPDSPFPMTEEWELVAALNALSPRERDAIVLLYKKNLTVSEAAATMDIAPDTVRSLKSHALKKLKRFFGRE